MDNTQFDYDEFANVATNCTPFIYGCMNPLAYNYDPNANTNDECTPFIYGCSDAIALNYDIEVNTDDGSCILPIYGCTYPSMFNYDPLANVDNDSCIPFEYGCTDILAFNFNPLANALDNTCCYISGCMDPTALNYDANACNQPVNACVAVMIGCTDVAAANYDSFANVADLEACNYDAGCYQGEGLPYWLNDECFAWVIDVDSYCCNTDWDASCISMYNYCQEGWPAGINDVSSLGIVIYPNPTRDVITIETHLDIQIQVYDMMGKLVIDEYRVSRLDLSKLSNGIYNMIILHEGVRYSKKVVKQ